MNDRARRSARADGQQDFLAQGVLELLEFERRFALVTQHFEHRGTAFFGYFHASAFNIHDVHLQRLDQEVPVIAAIGTGQVHVSLLRQESYEMVVTDAMQIGPKPWDLARSAPIS